MENIDNYIKKFKASSNLVAVKELFNTILFNFSLIYFQEDINKYLFIITLSLVQLRWFMIFHDLGHNSFFPSSKLNNYLHYLISFIVFTPYSWKYAHSQHHMMNSKSIDYNDTIYLTKKEYDNLNIFYKYLYVIFRNPIIYFTITPIIQWFIHYRIPIKINKWHTVTSKLVNTFVNILYANIAYNDVYSYYISMYICSILGLMLFHIQHTYENSYISHDNKWTKYDSALKGSSYIKIPYFLKWFTMGIEYHHIHHLNSNIPGYSLQKCHEEAPSHFWKDVTFLNYKNIYKSLKIMFYDEDKKIYY